MAGCHALLFQLKQFSQERIPKKNSSGRKIMKDPQPKSISQMSQNLHPEREDKSLHQLWAAADVFGYWPNCSLGSGRWIAKQMASCSTKNEIHSEGPKRSHECTMVVTKMSYYIIIYKYWHETRLLNNIKPRMKLSMKLTRSFPAEVACFVLTVLQEEFTTPAEEKQINSLYGVTWQMDTRGTNLVLMCI